ncbi:zinc ribbon domain-containing protein [Nakamurella deserti]|uniref:zinc ribbon domain-containing protein n=1 Tax=Nakamurella deserti TaxID=2164074 RepID=UPI000DBE85FF|nr:C4-type zinc ribbon domain-containing protein [Nakamurella deserti]
MPLKLDPFVQRTLLDLAATDRVISSAEHRRSHLPALAVIADGEARATVVRRAVVAAETEVSDLQRATNKLDTEVEQVRARARRDADRLASGSASPKELENLQHEIESLKRRQATLEDAELELMEQREAAEGVLAAARRDLAAIDAETAEAVATRDAAFAEIDAVLATEREKRAALVPRFPDDVLALYTRVKDQGRVAAGELLGGRCGACRMEIDRTALGELKAAPVDAVVRCPECGAILVRA